ncbi:MAG: bifunctional metallophosphatase/5'-nucleotidase [Schleiferiaceae bacterium]|nr:bifunctional metallophosphatase/5'-nucleotidase [Schleiferiaceae bacterium]
MEGNRRDFLKKLGLASAGLGVTAMNPLSILADNKELEISEDASNGKKGPVKIQILQTTDVHCQIHPHDEMFWENNGPVFRKTGGYAHLATYFKQQRKKNKNTLIIDTGDMFQGSKLSVQTTGQAMLPILNSMGYDLYIPGNWEVVYYKDNMQKLLGALNAPKLCTNMYHDNGDGTRGELIFQPYHIWRTNGVKIGFLSYTDHLVPKRQSPNYSKGIIYTKPEENLAHYVSVLRKQEGCDYVILLSHLGLSQQLALANNPACEGVDYIFGGDTHERVREPIICKYSKVVEPGAFGSFVGKLELTVDNGKIISEDYELVEINAKEIPADKELLAVIKENEAPFEEDIYKVIGHSTLPLYRYFVIENTIDTMILNALKWQVPDVDIALSNGFRFCPPRTTPDETGNVPITKGFVFDMLPVDSTLRRGEITGGQIRVWLEKELNNVFAEDASKRFGGWVIKFQGMEVAFEAFAPQNQRVKTITIGGKPLENNRVYSVMACERDGDPDDVLCRISGVLQPRNTPYTLHQAVTNYLQANSPVTPTPPVAAKVLDAPQTLLTQVSGVDYEFR